MKNIYTPLRIMFGLICLLLVIDKFYPLEFLGGCSLLGDSPIWVTCVYGFLEALMAITSLTGLKPRLTTYVGMAVFGSAVVFHLIQGTTDFGGAAVMVVFAILLRYLIYRDTMAQSNA